MVWDYNKVLVIGATSGIGEALAARFVEAGSFVIVSGRRKERLDAFVERHGASKVKGVQFDITGEGIPEFASKITEAHPDLDCVFVNSGIQRKVDFSHPEEVDLEAINEEINVNYLAPLALTKAFLPFLLSKESKTSIIYTTSGLALVPIPRVANYCASKAAMHHFILCLREQLKATSIKVIELIPPAVQTELHDAKHQPDLKGSGPIGMPLDEFTDEAFEGLSQGRDQIPVGFVKRSFDGFERQRQETFAGMIKMLQKKD